MLQGGGALLSTPPQSAADSPNLPNAPPATATSPTPDSVQDSPVLKPGQRHSAIAEAIVDDVFTTIGEVLSARDSSSKEFHSAVLRALSKEPLMVAEAETDQAPGTGVEVESCLNSSVSLLPCSAFTRLTPNVWVTWVPLPAVFSFSWGPQPATFFVLPPYPQSGVLLYDYPPPPPFSDVTSKDIRVVADRGTSLLGDWMRS